MILDKNNKIKNYKLNKKYDDPIKETTLELNNLFYSRNLFNGGNSFLFAIIGKNGTKFKTKYHNLSEYSNAITSKDLKYISDNVSIYLTSINEWKELRKIWEKFYDSDEIENSLEDLIHKETIIFDEFVNDNRPSTNSKKEKFVAIAFKLLDHLRFTNSLVGKYKEKEHCKHELSNSNKIEIDSNDYESRLAFELEKMLFCSQRHMYFHFVSNKTKIKPIGAFVSYFDFDTENESKIKSIETDISVILNQFRNKIITIDSHENDIIASKKIYENMYKRVKNEARGESNKDASKTKKYLMENKKSIIKYFIDSNLRKKYMNLDINDLINRLVIEFNL